MSPCDLELRNLFTPLSLNCPARFHNYANVIPKIQTLLTVAALHMCNGIPPPLWPTTKPQTFWKLQFSYRSSPMHELEYNSQKQLVLNENWWFPHPPFSNTASNGLLIHVLGANIVCLHLHAKEHGCWFTFSCWQTAHSPHAAHLSIHIHHQLILYVLMTKAWWNQYLI